MSTQRTPNLMAVDSFLPEVSAPASQEIGNASNRPYTFVYDSDVKVWAPGEVKVVEELMSPPVDKWGQPTKITKALYQKVDNGKGEDGELIVPKRHLVTKLGGDLRGILTKLFSQPGCPLYPVKGDGHDEARRALAFEKYKEFRVLQAHATIEEHRARCQRDYNAGLPPTPKPSYVREAEQDIDLFARTVKAGQGRYICRKDGDSFDFFDDIQAHILKNWPELETSWRSVVIDDVGGPNVYRREQTVPPAPLGPGTATEPHDSRFDSGSFPSAATRGIIRLAAKSGKILSPELIARLGSDSEKAVEDAMDVIMAPQNKEEKARAREWAKANPE